MKRGGFEFKITKFEKSSKDLDQLLASQITDKSKKGFGYNAVPSPHPLILNRPTSLDLSYSGLEEFKQPEVNEYGPRDSSVKPPTMVVIKTPLKVDKDWKEKFFCPANQVREEAPKKARENNDALIIEDWVSDDEDDVESITKFGASVSCPNVHKHMVPRAVLMKTGLKTVNNARPVNTVRSVNTGRPFSTARSFNTVRPSYTAHPKSTSNCARPKTYFQNQAQSTVHRPFYKRTALTKRSYNQNVNTGRQNVNTGRQNVNTVRARGFNVVKPSACWVWKPIKPNGASLSNSQLNDKGFVDSGCSRHMSGNIAHLSDFKDFDGGYVTFGGGANGGRITGKGTIKTDKLDFDDVYFVKELKFNLFSVSQMCDKKNYVLFTDSECLVLSPNFKLPDENQILLKIPRQDNMYSFDMKNIVPKDGLTCLVAKATSEESMLWHRRLGHVNFKNINKLVKENLVRDLPLKRFENDQTCVACLKGKQHRASCKTKAFNPITKPLFMLHMDLFGPTFVSSLMHKKYCLVVTDDYSRFSWVFFLKTKDETSEILKNFIKEIENLVDKKVKIIRSDNGTEFKNKVMDEFCREKGIKREYSIARTPQQNGVAERKNRTLIEAARTMLADSKLPTTFWAEAVSTACYVQNRVLIVKPHNKTPYELFRGIKPAIGFMKPFGCHVTILNTLDKLGKFDGKSDEENKPMIEGNGPKWLFDLDSLTQSMNYVPVVAGTFSNDFAVNTARPDINTGSREVSTALPEVNTVTPEDLGGPSPASEDSQMKDQEIVLGNIPQSYKVPTTPHTRIHKDHPIEHVIGDVQSSVQTRRMKISYSEKGFLSAIYEGKTHQDLYTCLCVCFLSQEEPKRVSQALRDPAWVEAMQENFYSSNCKRSGFLWIYLKIEEEVYVCQPPGFFEDPDHLDKVYKLLKSASTLSRFGKSLGSKMEYAADSMLYEHFIESMIGSLMLLQHSRPDIIVCSLCMCKLNMWAAAQLLWTVFSGYKIYCGLWSLQIKTGKARRKARVVLSDDEVLEDDSSKQGRKLSDAEVQEKARRLSFAEAIRLEEPKCNENNSASIAREEMKRLQDNGMKRKDIRVYGWCMKCEKKKSPEKMKSAEKMESRYKLLREMKKSLKKLSKERGINRSRRLNSVEEMEEDEDILETTQREAQLANELSNLMMQLLESVNERRAFIEELERLPGNFVSYNTSEELKLLQKDDLIKVMELRKVVLKLRLQIHREFVNDCMIASFVC
ncbi:putative ribonuclease H-like domain-containing protein [Tanacetum coccineum]